MSVAAAAIPLFGSMLSGFGGMMSASAQSKAEQRAQDRAAVQDLLGMHRLGSLLYGGNVLESLKPFLSEQDYTRLYGRLPKEASFSREQQAELESIDRQIASLQSPLNKAADRGPQMRRLQARREELMAAAGFDPGATGLVDRRNLSGLGQGILGQLQGLGDTGIAQGKALEQKYATETGQLGQMGMDLMKRAQGIGAGRKATIDRDTARQLATLQALTSSRLGASGVGGTILGGQFARNSKMLGESASSQKSAIDDWTAQTELGLGQNRLGMMAQRFAGGTQLGISNMDRETQFRERPLNTLYQALTSGLANPRVGASPSQFFTSPTSAGPLIQNIGNTTSALGGNYLGQQQLLELLDKLKASKS